MDITIEPPPTQSPESNDEAQTSLHLQTLELDLTTNPLNYNAHLQYITALRKQGDLDKLRLAREAMSQVFPLMPEMWRQWANDEVSLVSSATGHEGAFSTIEKLYERGVSDYLSVSLWFDYLSFVQKHDSSVHECSLTGISKARDLFERALIACGLHVAEGSKIWEAYRSYEEAILNTMNEADLESREKQIHRIRNLYHRQLSIPHVDLISTLLAYKTWEAKHGNTLDATNSTIAGLSPLVASAYTKASDMLALRAYFEEHIVKSGVLDTERLQNFMIYTKNEEIHGDHARVKSLYERAITEFPTSIDLWMNYTDYLSRTLKTDKRLRDCFNRATRNCPWFGELWVRFLLYIERCRGSEKELSDVFERSLQCTFSTIDEYIDIYLTRVDGLRRRITFAKELDDVLDFSLLRNTFERACKFLQPQLENTHRLLQIHSYWARLEVNIGKNIPAARKVWESLLKNSGSILEALQAYISMETAMGNIKEARSLYNRFYTKRFSGAEDICNSWIHFEREFGSLDDFDHASQKVTRLQDLQFFRMQQESKAIVSSTNHEDAPKKRKGEKRKAASDALPNEELPAKRQKEATEYKRDITHSKSSVKANSAETAVTLKDTPHGEDITETKDTR